MARNPKPLPLLVPASSPSVFWSHLTKACGVFSELHPVRRLLGHTVLEGGLSRESELSVGAVSSLWPQPTAGPGLLLCPPHPHGSLGIFLLQTDPFLLRRLLFPHPQLHTLSWCGVLFCGGVYVCSGGGGGISRIPTRQDAEHTLCLMRGAPVSQPGLAQPSFPEPLSPPGCRCLQIPGEWCS